MFLWKIQHLTYKTDNKPKQTQHTSTTTPSILETIEHSLKKSYSHGNRKISKQRKHQLEQSALKIVFSYLKNFFSFLSRHLTQNKGKEKLTKKCCHSKNKKNIK